MTGETIKDRIDLDQNNIIDTDEINNFIFDEKEWDKNLNELGTYLNKLPITSIILNNDKIKESLNNFFKSKEWEEIEKSIKEKLNTNKALDKRDLSLIYLNMLTDKFGTWQLSKNQLIFDANKPIHEICGWALLWFIKLKYNSTYTGESSDTYLEVQTDSGEQRPASEEEIKQIPKNLIKTWWEYIVKGTKFLAKGASWAIETIWEFVGGILRTFVDFSKIKSSPSEKNPKTGVTQCSTTARKNANFFWISLPNWNAKEWVHNPIIDKKHFINKKTKSWNNNKCIDINIESPDTANFADISVESDTINWRRYWHRATAFKNSDGQRYVLDPYYSWWYGTKPIPRDKYPKHTRAEQINFYNAPKQSKSLLN